MCLPSESRRWEREGEKGSGNGYGEVLGRITYEVKSCYFFPEGTNGYDL